MPDDVPEPDEIDWAAIRTSVVNVADMVHTYYQALVNAGFDPDQAMVLLIAYQAQMWGAK